MKKVLSSLFTCLLSVFILISCESTPTRNSSSEYTGITETDENRKFIGDIDVSDWSSGAYENIHIGDHIWVSPASQLTIRSTSLGAAAAELRIYNRESGTLEINLNINGPFYTDSGTFSLQPAELRSLDIKADIADSSSQLQGTLDIECSGNETIEIALQASWRDPSDPVESSMLQGISFYPAFPNPADHETTLIFSYDNRTGQPLQSIRIFQAEKPVKTFLNMPGISGVHAIAWDLTDNDGERVKPGIYQAILYYGDDEFIKGDIEVR